MTTPHFTSIWCFDTEFRTTPGELPQPVCLTAVEANTGETRRVWLDGVNPPEQPPFPIDDDTLVVGFFASVDLNVWRQCGWKMPTHVIDLYAVWRATTNGTFPAVGPKRIRNSLNAVLAALGLAGIGDDAKSAMRDLILQGAPYTAEQRATIMDYCLTDSDATARIFNVLRPRLNWAQALFHGRYVKAVSSMLEREGIPVDLARYQQMLPRWHDIQRLLIRVVDQPFLVTPELVERAQAQWPALREQFAPLAGSTITIYADRSFVQVHFALWCTLHQLPWPTLRSGRPVLQGKIFKMMSKTFKVVLPLRRVRDSLAQFKLSKLTVGKDGRNRTLLSPFRARSGRNQPSNSACAFLVAKWLRGLIRPPKGWVLLYADWSSQEMAICAVFSGDLVLLACYDSADAYLMFAELCSAVPAGTVAELARLKRDKSDAGKALVDAYKKRFEKVRDQFKLCMLMTLYGAGAEAIALATNGSVDDGARLLALHQKTFPQFWRWRDAVLADANLRRRLTSALGWTLHVNAETKPTTLANFHGQAGGAEMMMIASIDAVEKGLRICCPVHDALLALCREGEAEEAQAEALLRASMGRASRTVLDGFEVRVDVKKIRHDDDAPLVEKDDRLLWKAVLAFLDQPDAATTAAAFTAIATKPDKAAG